MICPKCNARIKWYLGAWGTICPGCASRVRNETARLLIWSLLVDALILVAYLLDTGFWLGSGIVVVGGVALFFLMGCKLDHPLIKKLTDT